MSRAIFTSGSGARSGAVLLVAALGAGVAGALAAPQDLRELVLNHARYPVEPIFQDDFTSLTHWAVEGDAALETANGALRVGALGSEATLWCRTPFDGPVIVQYDVRLGQGAKNINLFAFARHDQGLLETAAERTGRYPEYRGFENYIVTYLPADDAGRWRVRFRKNPGFSLLEEGSAPPVEAGGAARMTYFFDGAGTVRLYLNGEPAFESRDPLQPYSSGYFALRTWNSDITYSNFRVYAVVGKPGSADDLP